MVLKVSSEIRVAVLVDGKMGTSRSLRDGVKTETKGIAKGVRSEVKVGEAKMGIHDCSWWSSLRLLLRWESI